MSPPSGQKAKAPYAELTLFSTSDSSDKVSHHDHIDYATIDFCLTEGLKKTKEEREEEKWRRLQEEARKEET